MTLLRLCRTSDVGEGDLRQFNVGGSEILVINSGNHFRCLEARCTHAGAPLSEGELIGEILVCPWHGSRFNISDGSVVKEPARRRLRVYACEVKESYLFVEI